jgi:acetylornithine deacetylase/succinyl-diaminopimelate desuccinylase-like protein
MSRQPDSGYQIDDLDLAALVEDLKELVAIPSVVDPIAGTTVADVDRAGDLALANLRAAGLTGVRSIEMAPGAPRLVFADYRVPNAAPDLPTVLCYAHFDVVNARNWAEAFQPTLRDTPDGQRLFGRGASDDKSGIVIHLAAVRAFRGSPPVHLKIVLEGQEELGSKALECYIKKNPEMFQADVYVLADSGNTAVGCPTLTSSLRGSFPVDLGVSTLRSPVHSGMYGGPVPDAFFVLTGLLASLHDETGDVAVPGLVREVWDGVEPDEAALRRDAGIIGKARLAGTGSLGSRLYGKPSITVTGLDGLPSVEQATNILAPRVTARLSVRIPPAQDPAEAIQCLTDHLERVNRERYGATITVTVPEGAASGWRANTGHPAYQAAERALAAAYPGKSAQYAGQGASLPLVNRFQDLNPAAAILLWGTEEPGAMIHSDSESVSVTELGRMAAAEVHLLRELSQL